MDLSDDVDEDYVLIRVPKPHDNSIPAKVDYLHRSTKPFVDNDLHVADDDYLLLIIDY